MDKLSVIIPSYRDPLLNKTIESVLKAAKEDIEIIVFLDHWDPESNFEEYNNVFYIVCEENKGMRHAINSCVKHSDSKYIMKLDSHCDIDKGFDAKLKKYHKPRQISIPSRYQLNVDTWGKFNGPIDHVGLKFPSNFKREIGFRTRKTKRISHEYVDEIIIFQGSCWFMEKDFFYEIGGLDVDMFGTWGMEAQELSMKTWLCHSGSVVRNKTTWYAHYKKNIQKSSMRKNMLKNMQKVFSMCMLNEWPGQKETFKWLIDKWPLHKSWPVDWYTKEFIKNLKNKGYIKEKLCTTQA